jgi:hypothetical protein
MRAPLFSFARRTPHIELRGERPVLFCQGAHKGGERICLFNYLCAELWRERQVLMIPKCLQTLIVIEGYLEAFPEKVKKQKEGAVEIFVREAPLFHGVALN